MANTSLLQVRTSAEDKEKASEILEKLGTNLSAVVNMMIKQIILTEGIPFEIKMNSPIYSKTEAIAKGNMFCNARFIESQASEKMNRVGNP